MRSRIRRLSWVSTAGAAALLIVAQPAAAQDDASGPRWQAWLGCWQTSALASAPADAGPDRSMLCVVPTSEAEAVEIVSVESGVIESRSTIRADGAQHPAEREGCTGWESAAWSEPGTRLYLSSQFRCAGGVERESSGLMAFAPNGDWIDVQVVKAGGNSGVQAVRYRPLTESAAIPADLAGSISSRSLASSAARMAAAGRIGVEDVIEASRKADPMAVEAWLLERDQSFTVDARMLEQLADAGVSTRVIDLLVALSYPEVFAVDNSAREFAGRTGRPMGPVWDPWGRPGYGGGYYPYGGRRGGWYGGYPAVIVVRDPSSSGGSGGKAVKGGGYRQGGSEGSSQPTSRPSSGGDATRSGGGSGSSGGARTAKPKDD